MLATEMPDYTTGALGDSLGITQTPLKRRGSAQSQEDGGRAAGPAQLPI